MRMAAGGGGGGGGVPMEQAPPPPAPPLGAAEMQSRVQQLVTMGFDAQRSLAALQQAGGDVELALGVLLG
jgi:hypothetical protein